METFNVGFGNPDGQDYNTIVLSGIDLVFPLEMDLDGDPLQDDEVRLCNQTGTFDEVLTVSHPDVQPDAEKSLLYYRFRWVTPGVYTLMVRVAGVWRELTQGILVSQGGVFMGEQRLSQALPEKAMAPAVERADLTVRAPEPGRLDGLEGKR